MKGIFNSVFVLFLVGALNCSDDIFMGAINKNGVISNVMSSMRNQNQPNICGNSWAFAIASSMSDQFNLRKSPEFPEVVLSPQMLMSCHSPEAMRTCDYSNSPDNVDMSVVLESLKQEGLSDESCNNWHADMNQKCDKKAKCMDCANGENIHNEPNCFSKDYHSYKLKDFNKITSDKTGSDKLNEIANKIFVSLHEQGPVVCGMKHSGDLFHTRSTEYQMYEDKGNLDEYYTWVSIVGIKTTKPAPNYEKVWIIRHSFGENVGHYGLIYVNADPDLNSYDILSNCYSLEIDPTIEVIHNSSKQMKNLFKPISYAPFDIRQQRYYTQNPNFKLKADEGLNEESPIFWGNVNGVNYMTWMKNQHIPTYCGSCWAQAATSVINDRLNIERMRAGQAWPRFELSVQSLINCRFGGTCLGGDSGLVYQKAANWKIPTETCRVYTSKNPEVFACDGESRCSLADKNSSWALNDFNGIYVDEWVYARGEKEMKKYLKDGPIACSFEVTDEFEEYKANKDKLVVFEQQKDFIATNHAVSVVGWGEDDKGLYWIVRNSWGAEYGYGGLFYFRGGNTLGMEAGCQVPTKIRLETWKK